jgi:hypothetical protein
MCWVSGMLWSFVTTLQLYAPQTKILKTRKAFWTACLGQPSATRPHFGQTCLFTNFPNILTTIRGSEFKGIREKAGLSKMGVSCRRLDVLVFLECVGFLGCYESRMLCGFYGGIMRRWSDWCMVCNKFARWLQKNGRKREATCFPKHHLLPCVHSSSE